MTIPVHEDSPKPTTVSLAPTHVFLVLLLTALTAFLAGIWFSDVALDSPHDNDDFEIFWQSWDIVESEFYYDLPEEKEMIYGAIHGLLASTDDRYTFFSPPSDAEVERQRTAGEFGGIGAYVGTNSSGALVITGLFDGMPAQAAGLLANDVIIAVDGTDVAGWALDEALALIRGEVGEPVTLTVYREAVDREFDVEIIRSRVEEQVIFSAMYDNIGYIHLTLFNGHATEFLEEEIQVMLEQGVTGLILDLRGNPGGLLDQAVSVSDLFLGKGVVVTQRDRNGDERMYLSHDGELAEEIPLVVLINGGSASASEVVAGALRDRDRAILIGQTSFGKGSVQHVFDLRDGSQIRVTAAAWYTPDETPINGYGLDPDIVIEIPEDSETAEGDPVLDAALAYFDENESDAQPSDESE